MKYYKSGKITSSKLKTISQEIPPIKGKGELFKKIIETHLKSLREHVLISIEEKKKNC